MELEDQEVAGSGRSFASVAVSSVHALAFILMVTVGLVMLVVISAVYGFALLFVWAAWGPWWALAVLSAPGIIAYIIDRMNRRGLFG